MQKVEDTVDAVSEIAEIPSGGTASQQAEAFADAGGDFGGAGASGRYAEAGEAVADLAEKEGKSVGDKVGDLVPDFDEGAGFALLAPGVLLAVVFGAGLYLIYSAPAILSEAAFEFLLAECLLRRSKKMDYPDWLGSVLRAIWVPFAVVLAISVVVGWVLHAYYPEVVRISNLPRG